MKHFTIKNVNKGLHSCRKLTTGLMLLTAAVLFQLTSVQAQVAVQSEHDVATHPIVQIDPVAAELSNATGARGSFDAKNLTEAVDNPDLFLDLECGQLKVTLLLDESGSILNRDGIEQVEDATMALANVLLGTQARLSIVEFENTARVIFNQVIVTEDVLMDLEAYLTGAGYNGETYDPNNDGLSLPCPVGNTNWEAGLDTTLFETDPNLLVFLTDGEPTSYSIEGVNSCGYVVTGGSEPLNQAIAAANNLKGNGTHIFAYGVGSGVVVPNLQEVSGTENFADNPDIFTADYSTGSFEDLADNLSAGLNSICGTELLLSKVVDVPEVCIDNQELVFTLTIENTGGSTGYEATEVLLSDTFPAAFANLSIVAPAPAGAELDGQVLTYEIATLAVNESKTIQIAATLTGADDTYVNTAYADASNALEVEDAASVTKSDEFISSESIIACDSYTVIPGDWVSNPVQAGEQVLSSDNSPYEIVIVGETESGCPKTVTLNVTVNEAIEQNTSIETSCGAYTWDVNGETYTTSGTYTYFEAVSDDICYEHTLELTVIPATIIDGIVTTCDDEYVVSVDVQGFEFNLVTIEEQDLDENGAFYEVLSFGEACFIVDLTVHLNAEVGDSCDDGNPLTGDGTVQLDINSGDCYCEEGDVDPCADAGGDADEDGICDDVDDCIGELDALGVCNGDCEADADEDGICDDEDDCIGELDALGVCNGDCEADADEDGICDDEDDCIGELDALGVCNGDCEADADEDGICDDEDDCIGELDALGVCNGDCEADADEDGICDDEDDCIGELDALGVCNGDCEADVDGDGICDNEDPCPNLADLENGDACETDLGQDGVVVDCECQPNNNPDIIDCQDWVIYLADAANSSETDIYGVELVGGNAELTYIASVGYGAHIAYNPDNNLIYAVKNGDASYVTINPHVSPVEVSGVFNLSQNVPGVTTAVFSADGDLLIGSGSQNKIYSVDVNTNNVSLYDAYAPVSGGDIAFDDEGQLYLATRQGNALYEVYPDEVMDDVLIGSLPGQVTGMALMQDGRLLTSHNGNASLRVRNTDGSNPGDSFALMLDGEAFDHDNGDMASGCSTFSDENEGDCDAFSTFYSHHVGGSAEIYSVVFSGSNAILEFLTSVPFTTHIAYNAEDDILYLVNPNGNFVRAYDPSTETYLGDLPIIGNVNSVYSTTYNPADGKLYVGDTNDGEIYTIDLGTGQATFFADAPLSGGDLEFQNGTLYVANRGQGKLYEISGGSATLVGSIPGANGMAQANNATGLVVAHSGTSTFKEVSIADGSEVAAYTALVDGEALTLDNGDMAAGCGDDEPVIVPEGECYAVAVEEYIEGTQFNGSPLAADRADENNALGEPERVDALVFTTLGYGGSITVSFDGSVPNGPGDDIEVVETSYNNPGCASYPEYATVEVSMDGVNWAVAGTVCKGDPFVDISDAGAFDYVMYVRVSNDDVLSTAMDGFDVDGIVALHNCEESNEGGQGVEDLVSVDSQNQLTSFPNPTSGSSQVVFVTAETARTLVEVYDMNGRMVKALFNQEAEAGVEYRLDFNGTNLPNGVYIYRMTTENEVIVDKFMIAK